MALLYFGPEVLMPVLSAVAAAVGAILIVGKRALHWIQTAGRWIAGLFGATGDEEVIGGEGAPEGHGSSRSGSPAGGAGETVGNAGGEGARPRRSSSDGRTDGP